MIAKNLKEVTTYEWNLLVNSAIDQPFPTKELKRILNRILTLSGHPLRDKQPISLTQ